ncbi:MAG: hypothetical protein AAGE52_01545 [Myxococcota bacterium]
MTPELKAKWLKALRSGDYKQGAHQLRTRKGYCCLGVLCDVSGAGSWVKRGHGWQYEIGDEILVGYAGTAGSLCSFNPFGVEHAIQGHVADMNDCGRSFAEIADYLEEVL